MKEEDATELKALKDYALVKGELYRKMLGGGFVHIRGTGGSPEKIERCT